ncbi:uncharacterized protein LOC113219050 [Apis mellifera]|uniref:Uncharacterized protein LOC113219050 n=1 Tax=Apis mellifera TaxID=7460 RepID=A0A7M7MPU0_APIME|nr:uncharacterized protein LOC113219050 [Apis mellifera]|eukprot:XP_026299162.1 uncharacterized protein LOC113219050 [Apis mellifera]
MSPCVRCQDFDVLPDEVVRKMDVILLCLQNPNDIENIICRIKDVLYILERLTPCRMSEKIQILSLLLKEIVRKLVCPSQTLEESFDTSQIKMTLNLVNNFIRDWSEKRSKSCPSLRICRFCNGAIVETSRQWGTFCCEEAFKFNNIRIEWVLRQSISDASKEARDPGPRKDPRSLREEQFLDTEEGTRSSAETEEEATGGGRRGAYRPSNLHPPVCRRAGGDHRHEEGRDSVPRRGADTCDGLRVPLEGISGRDGIPRSPEEYLPDSSTSRGLGRDLDGEGARRRPRDGEGPDTDRRGAFAEKATGRRGLYRDAGGPRVEAEEDWRGGRSPRRRREVEEVEEERRGYPRKGRGREEEEEMEDGRRRGEEGDLQV